MHLVAIAWIYVVLMMSVAEATNSNGTLLGAIFTFILYGVMPLAIVLYLLATPQRRAARRAAQESVIPANAGIHSVPTRGEAAVDPGAGEARPVLSSSKGRDDVAAEQCLLEISSVQPNGGDHAAGNAVAAERKEA